MADANREAITTKVTEIAERVGSRMGIEIAGVELLGAGKARVLRIFIDRVAPSIPDASETALGAESRAGAATGVARQPGVTLADCEFISENVGTILDMEDVIPGESYKLEVSSPGVERKLTKPRDFERFIGHKVKIGLREPIENQRHWMGTLAGFANGTITLEPSPGRCVRFRLDQVEKAQLKFEW
jgi:ribosome maturation factor RimP